MKKIIIITVIALLSIGFNSCADQDSILDGKDNACTLKHLKERAKLDPTNKALKDSVEMYEMFIKIHRENSGNAEKFNKEIDEYLKTCE